LKFALTLRLICRATRAELEHAISGKEIDERVYNGTHYEQNFISLLSLTGDMDDRNLPPIYKDYFCKLSTTEKLAFATIEQIEQLFRHVLAILGRNMHGILPLFGQVKTIIKINY
jgi:hypothetical protein